ncbi:MAG: hypothetical protein R8G66_18780 [Cytophagales bacterium]|nr:hypothetical protein [Cytophagales bacterium]
MTLSLLAQPTGFAYHKSIEIQSAQDSGSTDLVNFPMLFSVTNDNDLRHTSQGGRVQHTEGYDIVFTQDDCYTILEHEIESYDGTSGTFIAWVKIPNLNPSSKPPFECIMVMARWKQVLHRWVSGALITKMYIT